MNKQLKEKLIMAKYIAKWINRWNSELNVMANGM